MTHTSPITDSLVAELAREASADRRSIIRAFAGLPVRGIAGERIRRALSAHGLLGVDATTNPPPKAA